MQNDRLSETWRDHRLKLHGVAACQAGSAHLPVHDVCRVGVIVRLQLQVAYIAHDLGNKSG